MEFELWCKDSVEAELLCHERLQKERISESREFFHLELHEAIATVLEVYAETIDRLVVKTDESLDPSDIPYHCYKLEQLVGKAFDPAEVVEALANMPTEIVYKMITEREKRSELRLIKANQS